MARIDPVHCKEEKWYFLDEVWANRIGPYDTEEQARKALNKYCEYLDHGNS